MPHRDKTSHIESPDDADRSVRARSAAEEKEAVLAAAIGIFAEKGFTDTKLSDIAEASNVSKRMLHYHFADKVGLYRAALIHAVHTLTPPAEVLEPDTDRPVDAVKQLVSLLFDCFQENSDCVRLVITENVNSVLDLTDITAMTTPTTPSINLDRVLLLGQEAGVFRPNISSQDLLFTIYGTVLPMFALPNTLGAFYGVNPQSASNLEGLKKMSIDIVLGFLTLTTETEHGTSYLDVNSSTYDHAARRAQLAAEYGLDAGEPTEMFTPIFVDYVE